MNRSTLGLPVHHHLPSSLKLTSIKSVMPSSHLILCYPLCSCPQSLPASGSFSVSQLFAWGGLSTGVSALASFLPKNTQGWSPLEWTGWISLQSKGVSRVFSCISINPAPRHISKNIHCSTHVDSQRSRRQPKCLLLCFYYTHFHMYLNKVIENRFKINILNKHQYVTMEWASQVVQW